MTCCKIFKFEAAHKLSKSYTAKCRHIHGHSYKCEIYIKAEGLNAEDVVVDFTKVKEDLGGLFDMLDHSLLIHNADPAFSDIVDLAETHKLRLITCSFNPTAEALAWFIFQEAAEFYNITKVVLWETETGKAEVMSVPPRRTYKISLRGGLK